MVKGLFAASCITAAVAQKAGTLTEEKHPPLTYSECTASGCKKVKSAVTIDANWRWLHRPGETTNCYTGNLWDCTSSDDCKNCVVEGADQEYEGTYGVKTDDDKLDLQFVTQGPYSKNIGSRVYLMDGEDEYKMFHLKNREFRYTVDDSELGCGLNGALYFVQMDKDGGASKHGHAGAKYGLGYCDAQCPHDLKFINGEPNFEDWVPSETDENAGTGKYGTCCTEIDIWEANSISTAFTMHSCDVDDQQRCWGKGCGDNGPDRFKGHCDKNGCDIQPRRLGNKKFFGPGPEFEIDSTKKIEVVTQFITEDGTDDGDLVEVKQYYRQNGKTIRHPTYTVNGNKHNTITDDFCKDWVATTQDGTNFLEKGGMKAMGDSMANGVVLVMSLWDDHYANMLWLDSTYPIGSTDPGADRGTCKSTSGVPKDVEENQPNSTVSFSKISFGPIGSTFRRRRRSTVVV